jgi:biopolymer transport protein ExbB/biopolymer transport protein TolQ
MEQVDFSIIGMLTHMSPVGWGVLIALIIMSVWSITVAIDRVLAFRRSRKQSLKAMDEAYQRLEEGKLEEAVAATRKYPGANLARIMGAAISSAIQDKRRGEPVDLEGAERAVEKERGQIISGMSKGMTVLATISATAPFVGLFGTVVGIINAFTGMATTGSGGLGAVAGGIAEALLTTAFGLFVAIPAVWIFNYFNGKLDDLQIDIDTIKAEILDFLVRPEQTSGSRKAEVGRAQG